MKYPLTIFFRYDKYIQDDKFFEDNKDNLNFTPFLTSDKNDLNKLFDSNYQVLVTYGENWEEYAGEVLSIIAPRMNRRWIHLSQYDDVDRINKMINYCYINNVVEPHENTRPTFSLFTTCYKSYGKIIRAYNSIKTQILKDWEWVILDDSPEDEHFNFLRSVFHDDKHIRLYKRSGNSGSIGNVKNEAVMLCRGKYVLEMDHDDEILPDTLLDATKVFDENPDVGFVYMDFTNLYENGNNFSYGDFFGLGYCGYYCQKHQNKWVNVAVCPNINNTTLSHIVAVPNHPRIWRRKTLMEMGNYSEFLPVSDDYELLLRTAVNTKMAKIPKMSYVQYMNDNNNNFSLIRNGEINRLCRNHLSPQCFDKYQINFKMHFAKSYENKEYSEHYTQIWRRPNYEYKYCNKIINVNHKKQFCIIGLEVFRKWKDYLRELYSNHENDFLFLDNTGSVDILTRELDYLGFDRMKCYMLADSNHTEMVNYFKLIYKSCDDYEIIDENYEIPSESVSEVVTEPANEVAPEPVSDLIIDSLTVPSTKMVNITIQNLPEEDDDETIDSDDEVVIQTQQSSKKLTIITPSIRPENLVKLKESINFDYVDEWIIVYDGTKIKELPNVLDKHGKIKEYIHTGEGISGNPQRNFALDLVENESTYLYFLDDDNIIHQDLYSILDNLESGKIYTFDQSRPKNVYPYKELLTGDNIELYHIDTAMFMIDFSLCKDIRWKVDKYNADGFYITECYENNKDNWVYINKTMAYYNKIE
jgi:glycosyltransferase involved in cell wall biosynthesis